MIIEFLTRFVREANIQEMCAAQALPCVSPLIPQSIYQETVQR